MRGYSALLDPSRGAEIVPSLSCADACFSTKLLAIKCLQCFNAPSLAWRVPLLYSDPGIISRRAGDSYICSVICDL